MWREQCLVFCPKDLAQNKKLQVRHTPGLLFQPGHRILARIPPDQLQFHGELVLRPAFGFTQFAHLRSDNVKMCDVAFDGATLSASAFRNTRFTAYFVLAFWSSILESLCHTARVGRILSCETRFSTALLTRSEFSSGRRRFAATLNLIPSKHHEHHPKTRS